MKVSVVIPTYNEEKNIGRCLESLGNQTMNRAEYELIVVDGNSKDSTRDIAQKYADKVIIQTRAKVGGARNDGADLATADIIATTDGDCVLSPEWLKTIYHEFQAHPEAAAIYGTVYPLEYTIKNRINLGFANIFSRLGYYTKTLYYTLGCNTAFRRDAFMKIGGYKVCDAGDDLEIARRIVHEGTVRFCPKMKVGFSMRRYDQFGTLKSLYEWAHIVRKGGDSDECQYSKREYK